MPSGCKTPELKKGVSAGTRGGFEGRGGAARECHKRARRRRCHRATSPSRPRAPVTHLQGPRPPALLPPRDSSRRARSRPLPASLRATRKQPPSHRRHRLLSGSSFTQTRACAKNGTCVVRNSRDIWRARVLAPPGVQFLIFNVCQSLSRSAVCLR